MEHLKRKNTVRKPQKRHTSIYLLPRHTAHLQFLVNQRGTSVTEVIGYLIDQSARSFNIKQDK